METKKNNIEFIPKFEKSFFTAALLGRLAGSLCLRRYCADAAILSRSAPRQTRSSGRASGESSRRRAQINLLYCFPEKSEYEREAIIDAMYASAPQAMVMMAELGLRDPQKILARVDWQGKAIIDEMQRNNEKVIFLVPHAWGVDIPAMLMASGGQKMAAMFHNRGNPVFDYVWNTVRRRFGGRMHARNDGIKPFIQSVAPGLLGLLSARSGSRRRTQRSLWISLLPTRPRCRRLAA